MDGLGHVLAVHRHVGEAAVLVGDELDLRGESDERRWVAGGRYAAPQREPCRGPVEEARVAEAVAELDGGRGADAALARRGRPIQGDDELRTYGQTHTAEDSRARVA